MMRRLPPLPFVLVLLTLLATGAGNPPPIVKGLALFPNLAIYDATDLARSNAEHDSKSGLIARRVKASDFVNLGTGEFGGTSALPLC